MKKVQDYSGIKFQHSIFVCSNVRLFNFFSNIIIALFFTFLAINANAQIGVWGGYGKCDVSYKSFDLFRASYNKVNATTLVKPMPGFSTNSSVISGGVEWHEAWIYGELFGDKMTANTTAEFVSGEKRDFELIQKNVAAGIGLGYGWDYFYVYAIAGFAGGDIMVNSSYVYNDGTRSFGSEKLLNGHNTGIYVGGYYGGTICIPTVKYVKIMLRAARYGHTGDSKFPLNNLFGSKEFILDGPMHPDGIPTNYESYITPDADGNYDYNGGYVGSDVKSWRFTICLNIEFAGFDD